jgi:hypothetical protein
MAEVTPDSDSAGGTDHDLDDVDDELQDDLGDGVEFDGEPIDSSLSDSALIASARRRHGALGGLVAAGMLGIDKVLGRKPREEIPVVVAAPTEPIDIDTEGITVPLDDHTEVISPPIPRTPPKVAGARRRRR